MGYIYKISNSINDKVYIGQTLYSIEKRWQEHCYCSKKEKLQHRPLYSAMNKHGIENFYIELLEECDNNLLDEREKYWINYYNSYHKGYNATIGGDGKRKPLPSFQELYDFYNSSNVSMVETAKHFDICQASVRKIFTENNIGHVKKPSLHDYQKIAKNYQSTKNERKTAEQCNCSENTVKRACDTYNIPISSLVEASKIANSKKVHQFDKKGKYIQTFSSLSEAGIYLGNRNKGVNIGACCRGKQKTAYGYIWSYDRNFDIEKFNFNDRKKPVYQIDMNTQEIIQEFDSVASTSEFLQTPRESSVSTTIASCARNEFFSAYGYCWLYKDLFDKGVRKVR